MSKHTPGPFGFLSARAANGYPVFLIYGQHGKSIGHALTYDDADRIVAALNACEGLEAVVRETGSQQ